MFPLAIAICVVTAVGLVAAVGRPGPAVVRRRLGGGRRARSSPTVGWRWLADRAERRVIERELAGLIDQVARGVRAGQSVPAALLDAGARAGEVLADDVALVGARLERGLPFVEAVERWHARRRGAEGVALAATALAVAATSGGRSAIALEGVATTLAERRELRSDARALAAQARASAAVMVAMPVFFVAVFATIDPSLLAALVTTRLGLICVALGLALEAVAGWWMHRIVDRVVV